MAAFELSFSFIMLLNFCHWMHQYAITCLLTTKGNSYYFRVSPFLQKRPVQNKFSLVRTYLCSIASETLPCLHWDLAKEEHQLNHVAFYGFSWLNMMLSSQNMVCKICRQIILCKLCEKRKAKKIGQKIKSCLCSFYIEYNLTNAYIRVQN